MAYQLKRRVCVVSVVMLALLRGNQASDVWAQARERTPIHAGRSEAAYRGGLVTPPLPKPQFTLTDTSGAAFDFRRETDGYVTLLFFGYASCPDQCPLHMSNIAMGLKKLPRAIGDQFKLVFVTTDPARDSRPLMRAWLNRFDKRFIGLTGSDADIESAQRAAGVPPATKAVRAGENYAVGHANFVLAYTKDNLAHVIYPGGVSQDDWVHDLPQLVQETWSSR